MKEAEFKWHYNNNTILLLAEGRHTQENNVWGTKSKTLGEDKEENGQRAAGKERQYKKGIAEETNEQIHGAPNEKKDGGEWSKDRGLESSAEDLYCSDTGDAHKSTEKIQLSIICSDLIAMVTEQWKILIKPAQEGERWWKDRERQDSI